MTALKIYEDQTIEHVNITHAEAIELSKLAHIAAVVSREATMNGLYPVYRDGAMGQYDPTKSRIR